MPINFSTVTTALRNSSGNNIPRIIQYKETTTTDHITKTNGQDISEFDVNITPSNSASHILLFANVAVGADTNADLGFIFRRTISGQSIGNLSDSNGTGASGANVSFICGMNQDSTNAATYSGWHLDHPNTTSQVTYGLRAYPNGSRTMYINRRGTDNTYTARSRLVCIEIGDI